MRIEWFINGFNQPELKYYGSPKDAPDLPPKGKKMKPFLQNYVYVVTELRVQTIEQTLINIEQALLICLEPYCDNAKKVFDQQHANKIGDFSFPPYPFPLAGRQVIYHDLCQFLKRVGINYDTVQDMLRNRFF